MKIILCNNYDEMSDRAAEIIAEEIRQNPTAILGLATGNTPIGIYERLCRMYNEGTLDFSGISSFNLDEYLPIKPEDPNSYAAFMHKHLWDKVNIKPENTHIPSGNIAVEDAPALCEQYDKDIEAAGGIDLQLLGIGHNGHIGFNEPADKLEVGTHVTSLTESTIAANSVLFENPEDMPHHAVTMGMGAIGHAKKVLLVVNGKGKHAAISALLDGQITTNVPATLLKMHPNLIIVCDTEAYYG